MVLQVYEAVDVRGYTWCVCSDLTMYTILTVFPLSGIAFYSMFFYNWGDTEHVFSEVRRLSLRLSLLLIFFPAAPKMESTTAGRA